MLAIDALTFGKDEDTGLYTKEITVLRLASPPLSFMMLNCPAPGNKTRFDYERCDRDDNEVITGWYYISDDGAHEALIIND